MALQEKNFFVTDTKRRNSPEQNSENSPPSTSPSNIFLIPKLATHNQCGVTISEWKDRKLTHEVETLIYNEHAPVDLLNREANKFKAALKEEYPDCKIWLVGSFAAGIAISSSDLDFSLEIPSIMGLDSAKFKDIWKKMRDYYEYPSYESITFTKVSVLRIKLNFNKDGIEVKDRIKDDDEINKVNLDVTIDNDPSKRNTQLLVWYSQIDQRFEPLCKAVKIWASKTGVKNSKNGGLNSFSVCLLVVFFLQQVEVLPNIQELFEELNGELRILDDNYSEWNLLEELQNKGILVGQNKSSLGALFYGFMKFYSEFNFETHWISIKRGKLLKKRDDNGNPVDGLPDNNEFIVIEDPFLEYPYNCGRTVKSFENLEKIQNEFHKEYEHIKNYSRIICFQTSERLKLKKDGTKVDERILEVDQFPVVNMETYQNWDKVIPGLKNPNRDYRIHPKIYYDLTFGKFGL